MCGIAGYLNLNNTPISSNKGIIKMLEAQRHRGPDDSGIVFFNVENKIAEEVGCKEEIAITNFYTGVLGFNRLSIQDLSYHGHQPMKNNDENVFLTLNGEIYNAPYYREELIKRGYTFKSTTDTEVVLNLYLEYGLEKMLSLLNGMFAIVVVDLRHSELIIARDRFGIKPMYYFNENNQLGFSSELKSFYALKSFVPTLNRNLLDEFLLFRNTRDKTLINEVKVLPPGHYLKISKDKETSLIQYFNIDDYSRNNTKYSLKEALADFKKRLNKSVKSQLISDVKLGCQLSGGVDSSVVTHMANDIVKDKNFESVSIIFDNASYSEEKFIDKVASNLNIKSNKFLMNSEYYLDHIKKATWHLESPINHPNTIGIYLLSQKAKKYVTVLLSGEGADEVFGGYNRFHTMKYRFGLPFVKRLIKSFPNTISFLNQYFNISLQAVTGTAFMPVTIAKKLKADFRFKNAVKERIKLYNKFKGSVFDKQVKYEIATYLPDLLIRQDKMSMAHSIENRVPFLDNEIVKESFNYNEKHLLKKMKNGEKFLVKELCSNLFDRNFAYRDKMGFGIPLRDFFKKKDFKHYLNQEVFPSIKSRNLFINEQIDKLIKNIDHLSYKEMEALWVIITLEIWLQQFIDRKISFN